MKKRKWLLWIAPTIVLIIVILWQILFRAQFPLFTIMGIDDDAELLMVEVMSTEIEFPFEHVYHSEEAEVIAQIEEDLRSVRCRVTGAASSIKDPFSPQVSMTIGGKDGGEEFLLMVTIDEEGEIIVPKNNYAVYCHVDDSFLHEYLSALVESVPSDDELPHVWNYEPSDDPVKTVESAICGQIEKSYCNAVGVYSAAIDWQEKDRAVKQYTDYREGWTEEYLDTHVSVVWVSYFVSYDSTKTNLQGGDVEQTFYLLLNDETQKWELWESAEMPLGERDAAKTIAANYIEKLSRVIYLYEDIDLSESTVLTYGYSPEMQYVVEKSADLKARRVEEGHFRTDWGSMYSADVMEFSEDSATVLVSEDIGFRYEGEEFSSGMGNEYTVMLKKLNGEWLVSSVEGGDTYSLKEMEIYHYQKAMPELYAQAGVETFSFGDTLSVQVSNVIKTEKRTLPAEDNFEYEVYTVLPGAEIEVMHAAVEDTVELGPLGIWKVYSKDGNLQYLEPNMENIPITENTNGIGAESVCVLVFELYTGENAAA